MKYILFITAVLTIGCKQKVSEISRAHKIETKKDTLVVQSAKDTLITKKDYYEDVNIAICTERKKDTTLYRRFIENKNMIFSDSLGGRLFARGFDEEVNRLLQTERMDCMVSLKGGKYNIFDLYYKGLKAEKVYNAILHANENENSHKNLHDFFKRGMVFILNKKQNKVTVLVYNPFADNAMPARVKTYFQEHATEFDRVLSIIGIGYIDILVE